jgi:hypothetical protein
MEPADPMLQDQDWFGSGCAAAGCGSRADLCSLLKRALGKEERATWRVATQPLPAIKAKTVSRRSVHVLGGPQLSETSRQFCSGVAKFFSPFQFGLYASRV